MTQRQSHHQVSTPARVTALERGNLGTVHSLQASQQVGECPFQVTQLVWSSVRQRAGL